MGKWNGGGRPHVQDTPDTYTYLETKEGKKEERKDAFVFSPAVVAHILNPSLVYKVPRQPGLSNKETLSQKKQQLMTGASLYLQDRPTLTLEAKMDRWL